LSAKTKVIFSPPKRPNRRALFNKRTKEPGRGYGHNDHTYVQCPR